MSNNLNEEQSKAMRTAVEELIKDPDGFDAEVMAAQFEALNIPSNEENFMEFARMSMEVGEELSSPYGLILASLTLMFVVHVTQTVSEEVKELIQKITVLQRKINNEHTH